MSAHSAVGIPATGAPIPSLSGLLQDAYDLEYEARTLRARFDMALALNAGLACHASVLHDRNLARLQRAREEYQLGASTVNRLHEQLEGLQLEHARLEDVAAGLQTPAVRADEYETRYRVLEHASTETAPDVRAELDTDRAHVADLTLRLAVATAPSTLPTIAPERLRAVEGERGTAHAELASAQSTLSAVQTQLTATC